MFGISRKGHVEHVVKDAAGSTKSQMGSDVAVGTNDVFLPSGTNRGSMQYILFYTKNPVGLQAVPASVIIMDLSQAVPSVSVSTLSFLDTDTGSALIGGIASWQSYMATIYTGSIWGHGVNKT